MRNFHPNYLLLHCLYQKDVPSVPLVMTYQALLSFAAAAVVVVAVVCNFAVVVVVVVEAAVGRVAADYHLVCDPHAKV